MLLLADSATTRGREALHREDDLMQRAAASIWRNVLRRWPAALRILVVAGDGNNGADGRLVASIAQASGRQVVVMGVEPDAAGGLELPPADLIVDALLGIGLQGTPRPSVARLIEAINAHPAPVLSVDVPSGVEADTGHVADIAVRADVTLQLLDRHQGLYTGAALDHCGEHDFDPFIESDPLEGQVVWVDIRDARSRLPRRRRNAHKGLFGHVAIVGGQPGMAGAGLLASKAALRSGAGKVTWATAGVHAQSAWLACPELLTADVEAHDAIDALMADADVFAVGPGSGRSDRVASIVERIVQSGKPTVLDADALNVLAALQRRLHHGCVLTPHPLEAARLLQCDVADVNKNRFAAARGLAARFNATCVLKGAGTIVVAPDGETRVIGGGHSGMAVAGMGDALTGIVASLMGQSLNPFDAAWVGACLHAAAGDALNPSHGDRGVFATELIDQLPAVMKG